MFVFNLLGLPRFRLKKVFPYPLKSVFPLSSKINIFKLKFGSVDWIRKFQIQIRKQDLPENHFRVSGASWVNIIILVCFNKEFKENTTHAATVTPQIMQWFDWMDNEN